MPSEFQRPLSLELGELVEVRDGPKGRPFRLQIEHTMATGAALGRCLDGPTPTGAGLVLRRVDAIGSAWRARAIGLPRLDGRCIELRIASPWREVDYRRQSRVSAGQEPLPAVALTGTLGAGVLLDLVCVDLSQTGCLARGFGSVPSVGDRFSLSCGRVLGLPRRLAAAAVRVDAIGSRHFEAAFCFELDDAAERQFVDTWLARWTHARAAA